MTTKIYKNPNRSKLPPNFMPYVPEYKKRGIEPQTSSDPNPFKGSGTPLIIGNGPRNIKLNPTIKNNLNATVPYAEAFVPPEKNTVMPNVGNNVETVWSSIDGNIVDDLDLDDSTEVIDNNDYLPDYSLNITNLKTEAPPFKKDNSTIDLQEDEYLLAVDGIIISSGSLEPIQNEVKALVLGKHELYKSKQLDIENIIVLKRVKIKMGVFLDG